MASTTRRSKTRRTNGTAAVRGVDDAALDGVRRLNRGLRLAARGVERATGMSAAQLFVLEQLASAPAASIGDLAERTHTDRSSVSVVVERLVARRLVTRVASEGDRRRSEVRITRAGMQVLRRAPMAPTEMLIRALGMMTPQTKRSLGKALQELNERLGFAEAAMLFED